MKKVFAVAALLMSGACVAETIDLTLESAAPDHPLYKGTSYGANEWDEDYLKRGIEIIPNDPFGWISTNKDEPIGLTIKVSAQPAGIKAVLSIVDYQHRVKVYREYTPPIDEPLTINQDHYGTYLVMVDLVKGGEVVSRLVRSFAVVPDNRSVRDKWRFPESDFALGTELQAEKFSYNFKNPKGWLSTPFGPYLHPDIPDFATALDMAAEVVEPLGMSLYRAYRNTDQRERQQILDILCKRHGFDLVWKVPDDIPQASAESYVRTNIDPDCVSLVEVGNEPDNQVLSDQGISDYAQHVKWMSEAVAKLDPTLPVTVGGLTPPRDGSKLYPGDTSENTESWRTDEIIARTADFLPIISWHGHGSLSRIKNHVLGLKRSIQAHNATPRLIQTEGGDLAMDLEDEFRLGHDIIQKMAWSWATGTEGWIYYATSHFAGPRFYPPRAKWNSSGQGWGLVDYFWAPRFSYGTIAGFAHVLAGAKDDGVLLDQGGQYLIQFTRGADKILVAFDTGGDSRLAFSHDGSDTRRIDPFGNDLGALGSCRATVDVSAWPQYFVLSGAAQVAAGDGLACGSAPPPPEPPAPVDPSADEDPPSPTDSANLALGHVVAWSAEQAGNEAADAADGSTDPDDRWSALGFPQWIEIDLLANHEIGQVVVHPYQDRAYQYRVEYKPDGFDCWGQLVDRSENTEGGESIADEFAPVTARRLRLTVLGAIGYTGPWTAIREIAVHP